MAARMTEERAIFARRSTVDCGDGFEHCDIGRLKHTKPMPVIAIKTAMYDFKGIIGYLSKSGQS
jgi:hypothetical protein